MSQLGATAAAALLVGAPVAQPGPSDASTRVTVTSKLWLFTAAVTRPRPGPVQQLHTWKVLRDDLYL